MCICMYVYMSARVGQTAEPNELKFFNESMGTLMGGNVGQKIDFISSPKIDFFKFKFFF